MAVSPDGTKLLVSHSYSNTNNDVYLLDLVTGEEILTTGHQGDLQSSMMPISPPTFPRSTSSQI